MTKSQNIVRMNELLIEMQNLFSETFDNSLDCIDSLQSVFENVIESAERENIEIPSEVFDGE